MTRSKDLSKYNGPRLYATFISLHLVGTSLGSFIGGALGELFNPNYHYVFFIQALSMLIFAIYVLMLMDFKDEEKNFNNISSSIHCYHFIAPNHYDS